MLAKHPITGAPIRIMKSEGSIWRDAKTINWLSGAEDPSISWNRYDIGASSVDAFTALSKKGIRTDVCILLGDTDTAAKWIEDGNASKARIIVVPKAVLLKIGYKRLFELRINNMLCIEETIELYPFLEVGWDGTEDDARLMTTIILRYLKTNAADCPHLPITRALGITVLDEPVVPSQVFFITQYYTPDKTKRQREIDLCLKKNIECAYIDKIVLLNEKLYELPYQSEKVRQVNVGSRLRFDTVFKWIYENVPAGAIVVIANSDIYMDESMKLLWSVSMKDKFLSLLRWDDSEDPTEQPKLFGPRADSQDTWIISSDSVKERTWNWADLAIPFGKGGCDNAINIEMLRKKFLIVNPCLSLITHHVHTSGYRTYNPRDIVEKPMYMYINPTGIHDLKPELIMPGEPFAKLQVKASVPLLAGPTERQKETFYTMLDRNKVLNKSDGIVVGDRSIPLYKYTNVIESYDGLLSSYSSLYIGPSKTAADAWSAKEMNIASSCVDVDVALVAYCSDEIANNPYKYMLNYLGKILVLGAHAGTMGEFLGPNNEKTKEVVNLFNWKKPTVPILGRDPSFQAWCRVAYVWPASDGGEALVTPQEIAALRKAFQFKWDSAADESGKIVCVLDDAWITEELVASLEKELGDDERTFVMVRPTDSLLDTVQKFNGAAGMLTLVGQPASALAWLLPAKAKVWEIQNEINPNVTLLHLCDVAGLRHTLHIVARALPQNATEKTMLFQAMCKAIGGAASTAPIVKEVLPQILMPAFSIEGFFAHNGDSFREMVKMWAERKYVVVKDAPVKNIWLGGVGQTLLYDRPTLQWLSASPVEEQTWVNALFGNPVPPENGSVWSFWPRRPRIVEELVAKGLPAKGFADRSLGLVFYGRSENQVQLANRTKYDWSKVCDEYIHLSGVQTPYPYSHREYLERLSNARWGLCLAGFGSKCHREIECMAMGCVPIVAPEVDMSSYAEPPIEGVHYLRASSPDDVLEKMRESDWLTISAAAKAWWARNCSVKGLWDLTQALQSTP
jgi:hypothetical protein